MALSWVTIENAIHDWLKAAVGVTVILANQDGPQPSMPYCTVHIEGPMRLTGMDELRSVTNLGNSAGQEVEQTVAAVRELIVNVQAFTQKTVQQPGGAGDVRVAYEILQTAHASLDLPSVQDAFDAAGLVVVDKENIHNVSTVLESKWQGRASFDFRLRLTDSVVEKTGYVDGIITSPPTYL